MPTDAPLRYRIILRGECGSVLLGILSDATIESRRGWTCVIATVGGEAGFYDLLGRFQDLALQVVSINQLDADATGAEGIRAAPGCRDRPERRAGVTPVSQPTADPRPAAW
jgi:hypothetical protein